MDADSAKGGERAGSAATDAGRRARCIAWIADAEGERGSAGCVPIPMDATGQNRPGRYRRGAQLPSARLAPDTRQVNCSPPSSPCASLGSTHLCWRAAIVPAVYDKSIDPDQLTSYLCAASHFTVTLLTTPAPNPPKADAISLFMRGSVAPQSHPMGGGEGCPPSRRATPWVAGRGARSKPAVPDRGAGSKSSHAWRGSTGCRSRRATPWVAGRGAGSKRAVPDRGAGSKSSHAWRGSTGCRSRRATPWVAARGARSKPAVPDRRAATHGVALRVADLVEPPHGWLDAMPDPSARRQIEARGAGSKSSHAWRGSTGCRSCRATPWVAARDARSKRAVPDRSPRDAKPTPSHAWRGATGLQP
ncbi:hypothetical protein M2421_004194 [Stenotrophomonas sp. BIGb0135]|nr:hypothetical protein [Stenotrophomonas sp. BIGb0135]